MLPIERVISLLFTVTIILITVFQYIIPVLSDRQTFSWFRGKKLKGIPKTEVLRSALDDLDIAEEATNLEVEYLKRKTSLSSRRAQISTPQPVQKTDNQK